MLLHCSHFQLPSGISGSGEQRYQYIVNYERGASFSINGAWNMKYVKTGLLEVLTGLAKTCIYHVRMSEHTVHIYSNLKQGIISLDNVGS